MTSTRNTTVSPASKGRWITGSLALSVVVVVVVVVMWLLPDRGGPVAIMTQPPEPELAPAARLLQPVSSQSAPLSHREADNPTSTASEHVTDPAFVSEYRTMVKDAVDYVGKTATGAPEWMGFVIDLTASEASTAEFIRCAPLLDELNGGVCRFFLRYVIVPNGRSGEVVYSSVLWPSEMAKPTEPEQQDPPSPGCVKFASCRSQGLLGSRARVPPFMSQPFPGMHESFGIATPPEARTPEAIAKTVAQYEKSLQYMKEKMEPQGPDWELQVAQQAAELRLWQAYAAGTLRDGPTR